MASNMCSRRPLSLIGSLIDNPFITIGRLLGKRHQRAIGHKVNISAKQVLQLIHYMDMLQQTYMVVEINEDIHITILSFLATSIRAEEPSPLYWLGDKIVSDCL